MKIKIIAVLITILAVSLVFVLVIPNIDSYGDWNAACVRSCNSGYTSCVNSCTSPDCHWWCYDLWGTCIEACSSGGMTWEPNYYC